MEMAAVSGSPPPPSAKKRPAKCDSPDSPIVDPRDCSSLVCKARILLGTLGNVIDELSYELERSGIVNASTVEHQEPLARWESEATDVSVSDGRFMLEGVSSFQLGTFGQMSFTSGDSTFSARRVAAGRVQRAQSLASKYSKHSSGDRPAPDGGRPATDRGTSQKKVRTGTSRAKGLAHSQARNKEALVIPGDIKSKDKDPLAGLAIAMKKSKAEKCHDSDRIWSLSSSADQNQNDKSMSANFGFTPSFESGRSKEKRFAPSNSGNDKWRKQKVTNMSPSTMPTLPRWESEGLDDIELICTSPKQASQCTSAWQDCDGQVAPERARMENGHPPEGLTRESWDHLKKQMEAQNVSVVDWLEGNGTIPEEDEDVPSPREKMINFDESNFKFPDDMESDNPPPTSPAPARRRSIPSLDENVARALSMTASHQNSTLDDGCQSLNSYYSGPSKPDEVEEDITSEMTLCHYSSVKMQSAAEIEKADKLAIELVAQYGQPLQRNSPCMLSPTSAVRITWDLVWCCCLLFDLWITPWQVAFFNEADLPPVLANISIVVLSYYFGDILLNFRTGYTAEDGDTIVMDQRLAAFKYFTHWFWFDILVTVPWDEIFRMSGDGDMGSVHSTMRAAKASKAFRVLKVLKLLRIIRLIKTFKDLRKAQTKRAEKALLKKEAKRRKHIIIQSGAQDVWSLVSSVFAGLRWVVSGLAILAKPIQLVVVLLFLAHVHACLWQLLRPDTKETQDINVALTTYYELVCIFFNMLTFGAPLSLSDAEATTPGLWTFEMVVLVERLLLAMKLMGRLLLEASIKSDKDAGMTVNKEGAMNYMVRHNISAQAQLQVMQNVNNTGDLQSTQRHFKNLMEHSIPANLQRQIEEELWSANLLSLGIIEEVNEWNENLVTQLTQRVAEEVYAQKVIVFREGDHASYAYKVLSGEAIVVTTATKRVIPPFCSGMWVGEKVLINPDLRRSATMVTKTVCVLMGVPAEAFYDLICDLNLLDRFQTFCSEELWRGLCGRCGALGDHFAQDCPLLQNQKAGNSSFWKTFSKNLRSQANRLTQANHFIASDLRMFLEYKQIQHLAPHLCRIGIIDLKDLEEWNLDETSGFSAPELKMLSVESIQEFRSFKVDTSRNFFKEAAPDSQKSDHFMFLSHYKVEAGSEAALMRMELEHILGKDMNHASHHMDCPIFLDSDNLTNLEDLQERVRASWNLLVLLTPGVLKRPYCLVEIATALKSNVQVILINVDKPGSKFEFPDDKFYEDFMAGKVLSRPDVELLEQYNCTLEGVRDAIRQTFIRIALPYSPHRATGIRQAELQSILDQCATKPTAPTPTSARRRPTNSWQESKTGDKNSGHSMTAARHSSANRIGINETIAKN